jgi:histone H3/H4
LQKREFSFYDIELFLREAGAKRIDERTMSRFERQMEEDLTQLLEEAKVYANHAGRSTVIKTSDINLIGGKRKGRFLISKRVKRKAQKRHEALKPRLLHANL